MEQIVKKSDFFLTMIRFMGFLQTQ